MSASNFKTRIIAVANMKGGVGKTTTSINLSACLADRGNKVLVVDLDPQANATSGLGIDPQGLSGSIYDILMDDLTFEDCVEGTSVKNLFILPSNPNLSGAEVELANAFGREHRLGKSLNAVVNDYDYIFIDCPPSLGLLTVNALTFATEVLIPIQCEYFALEGLGQLLENMELVREHLNPNLELRHIVLVMFNANTNLSKQVEDEVRTQFKSVVCEWVVPRSVSIAESPKTGLPISKLAPSSKGALAYIGVAEEIDLAKKTSDSTSEPAKPLASTLDANSASDTNKTGKDTNVQNGNGTLSNEPQELNDLSKVPVMEEAENEPETSKADISNSEIESDNDESTKENMQNEQPDETINTGDTETNADNTRTTISSTSKKGKFWRRN